MLKIDRWNSNFLKLHLILYFTNCEYLVQTNIIKTVKELKYMTFILKNFIKKFLSWHGQLGSFKDNISEDNFPKFNDNTIFNAFWHWNERFSVQFNFLGINDAFFYSSEIIHICLMTLSRETVQNLQKNWNVHPPLKTQNCLKWK